VGLFDAILKQLVADDALTFAAWLLNTAVDAVEPLTVELPGEPIRADTVFRVQRHDATSIVLHIEFQGRTSRPPMPWRMLDYMARLAQEYRLPIHSAVLYLDQGAGSQDTGQHEHLGADGSVVLAWSYQVVHLWRMRAEDLLGLGRRSLLPLVGLTRIERPAETMPQVLAAIQAESDMERQLRLLRQMIDLLPDKEVLTMTEKLLSAENLAELKRFPALWRDYQEAIAQQARADILEVLAARFDPPISEYHKVEQALAVIDNAARLRDLLRHALRVSDLAEFLHEVISGSESQS
jgi:predicted transposase YdaD